jgi:hypothetical protein
MSPPFPSLLRKLGLISLFGAAAAAITLWLWGCFCMFSAGGWNAIRLAPSFMWQAGVNPYPGPFEGPVTTWIYGPLPIILQWPATLLHDAAAALMAAGMINLFVAVVPLGAAVCAQAAPGTPNATRVWALLLALACWPAVNLIFYLADNTAIACGLIAAALVASAGRRDHARLWAAAAAATLALCSKQTEFGPVLGQIAYFGFRYGGRAATAQVLRIAAAGGFFGLVFCGLFGAEGLIYNMFVIPAGFPLIDAAGKIVHPLYLGYVLTYVAGPALLIVLQARRLLRREHPALAPILVFACSIPFNLASFLNIGGNTNSLHGAVYLFPAAALWLAARRPRPGGWPWPAPVALAAALAVQVAGQWPLPMRPQLTGLRQGAALARQLPGQVYFPWNPLLTYFSEGRFDHAEDGLIVRSLAGRPVPPPVVKAYLPPTMCVVAYHRYIIDGYVRALIPADAKRDTFGEWILLSWPPPKAAPNPR